MGAAGSSNTAPSSSSPFRERGGETFVHGTEESCCPDYANENIRQRTRTNVFDVGEEPRSQGPSPYATLRGEEWWSQRPSAPSLSNLRSPQRDTLLTYAAQMTGWQTAEGHSPSFSQQHQETMELSKVISQLAMANHQLASAHTATLAHLETLYVELKKEKELRRRAFSLGTLDEVLKKRLTMEEQERVDVEEEDGRRMEIRVDRLENELVENWDTCQGRQGNIRQEEDRKLRSRIERLENATKSRGLDRDDERQRFTNICDPVQNQMNGVACGSRLPCNNDVPEREFKTQISMDEETVAGSTSRISVSSGEERSRYSRCKDGADSSAMKLHLEKSEEDKCRVDEQGLERKEIARLTEEAERSKAEQTKYQSENERLTKELAEQNSMVVKLTKDYEESKTRHEETESSLQGSREEYEKLMRKFEIARKEMDRSLKKIDAYKAEKNTAEERISSLEQDLQNALLEKEFIRNMENQKTSKLKAQLSEEISDKKKHIKALEDALGEIQRLKETIETEKDKAHDGELKENAGPLESIDDPEESPPGDRATSIEEFRKELTLKREARQRAIAAVSSEMERLRRELDAEKEAHTETSRVLDLLRSAQTESQAQVETNSAVGTSKRTETKDEEPDEPDLVMQRAEAQRLTSILKVSDELRNDIRVQIDKVDDLRYQLETEPDQHRYRIRCLSDLTNRMREAVYKRERRTSDVKGHLAQILVHFSDRSFLEQKNDVAEECERQLENMNSLKSLYNERLKVLSELKESAVKELADTKIRLNHTVKKCECLEDDLKKADEKIDVQDTELSNLESQLGLTKADCRDLQNQMSLINGLFTQMLLGATSADMDLDRLTQLLQENHDLICNMAREEGTEAAALPKLLLDLIEQVEGGKGTQKRTDGENTEEGETEKKEDDLQQEDIAHNLPKVWRVLLELLSCHAEGAPSASVESFSDPNICYKSVDTPAGPRLVISVSKTYIRLKELILEKKHLEKEMNRMKQLNTHLESKLGEQEKRLSAVSAELSKTWTIVDRMQAQHQQLHTHEKILRYELQQKRKMLQELKQELEYCREKWESARQKNTNTELEWRSLRREFAARKALAAHDSFNNSGESGFSDERGDDTDDEDNAVEDRVRLGLRRRPRKESPRAPSPDTESEQPTDTELSESKLSSPATMEQRTPTPETEAELDETDVTESPLNPDCTNVPEPQFLSESPQEVLDPLDQALTNVIQNLIGIEDNITSTSESFTISSSEHVTENLAIEDPIAKTSHASETKFQSWSSFQEPEATKLEKIEHDDTKEINVPAAPDQDTQPLSPADNLQNTSDTDGEKAKNEEPLKLFVPNTPNVPSATIAQSVFSIGPFPAFNTAPSVVKNVQFNEPLIAGPSNQFFAPVFGTSDEQFVPPFASSTSQDEESARNDGSATAITVDDPDNVSTEQTLVLDKIEEPSTLESTSSSSPGETSQQEMSSSESAGSSKPAEEKIPGKSRTPEEALAAREDRLKRLEEQAKWLMNKMNATSRRGSALSSRLEELHEVYGEPPVPPPMPDVLPSRRLRTHLSDLPRQVPESSTIEDTKNTEQSDSSEDSNESPSNNAP